MKFTIVTHVPHIITNKSYYAYSAYVREMNIWAKHVDELIILAPVALEEASNIHLPYTHANITFKEIPSMAFTSFKSSFITLLNLPIIIYKIGFAFYKTDHIHLRCPGTIALLGCFLQILFPRKPKTVKYAGNWDPNAAQPFSYRLQKKILSNTSLTKNMKVLVYGNWSNQTKNIIPFFTASYSIKDVPIKAIKKIFIAPFRMMFVGTLSPGKQPLYALQIVESLNRAELPTTIDFFGEGDQRCTLESYIETKKLTSIVTLHGNTTFQDLEKAYKESQFVILPSISEGWPKVLAEAMFWGTIPIATSISCVPWMLGEGSRGILLSGTMEADIKMLEFLLYQSEQLHEMSMEGQRWSQDYTLDRFEERIKKLLL